MCINKVLSFFQIMANGENTIATAFAMHLCKIYLIDDRTNANIIESDLFGTIEVLQRIRYDFCFALEQPSFSFLDILVPRLSCYNACLAFFSHSTQSPRPPDGIVNMMETIKMSSERLEQNLAMSGPTAQV